MSDIEWTPAGWDQVKPGDKVKLVHDDGEQAIIGTASDGYTSFMPLINNLGGEVSGVIAFHAKDATWSLFIPRTVKPALPTTPGAYKYDGWSSVAVLNERGDWRDDYGRLVTMRAVDAAALTPLAPVAETAKKMRDRLFTEFEESERSYAEDVEFVAAEFGVTGGLGE